MNSFIEVAISEYGYQLLIFLIAIIGGIIVVRVSDKQRKAQELRKEDELAEFGVLHGLTLNRGKLPVGESAYEKSFGIKSNLSWAQNVLSRGDLKIYEFSYFGGKSRYATTIAEKLISKKEIPDFELKPMTSGVENVDDDLEELGGKWDYELVSKNLNVVKPLVSKEFLEYLNQLADPWTIIKTNDYLFMSVENKLFKPKNMDEFFMVAKKVVGYLGV